MSEEALVSVSKSQYQVGGDTAYIQIGDGPGMCDAYVQVAAAHDGYGLRVQVDPAIGQLDPTDLCQAAVLQTEKVLQALGGMSARRSFRKQRGRDG
ncbi:hypothetical protein [Gordonia alkanivorans]|uniref:hypothetical protein n=1 Tax=Gordonia alkanivorans TaxID=84096 RepID=UPI0004B9A3C6|nr:hypothetical protein [Gordonia alkanivorans]